MTRETLLQEFRAMLGWRYEWGAAREGCVDCSGAFVYAMNRHGMSIYHGSNTIWRAYLTEKGAIDGEPPLGAAVFKNRASGREPEKYRGDGIGDMYHIGLYAGDGVVLEARSPEAGFVEGEIGRGWTHWGLVKGIDYGGGGTMEEETRLAVVTAETGSTVNLRREPNGPLVRRVPLGTEVDVLFTDGGWAYVDDGTTRGYMMETYLRYEHTEEGGESGSDELLSIEKDALWDVYNRLGALLGVRG